MFSSVQVVSEKKSELDWQPILTAFDQAQPEKMFLISCQINYKELNLEEELGKGSFGIVYKGSYQFAQVAVKKLHTDNLSSSAYEEFRQEAEMMAQLRHPNIVHFYGYCSIPKCLVIEYMPKGSLFSVLQDKAQTLDWKIRIRIAKDMVSGLAFLHSKNILHRDIKSLNVLLDAEGKAKLTDFGLSKIKNESKSLTKTHKNKELVGTLPWIAPELFDKEKYTDKSDIYSLGITLWELASRRIPYAEDAQEAIPVFVGRGKRETIPSDCDEKLAYLIQECWATNPKDRPNASDVAKFMATDAKTFDELAKISPSATTVAKGSTPVFTNQAQKQETASLDAKHLMEGEQSPGLLNVNIGGSQVSSLIEAVKQNNQVEVSRLLDLKTMLGKKIIDEADEDGNNALYWAAALGYVHFIDPLIKAITASKTAGMNVDTPNKYGITAMHAAAAMGHGKMIFALKAAGANVNMPTKKNGITPLYIATQKGHVSTLVALLEGGAEDLFG